MIPLIVYKCQYVSGKTGQCMQQAPARSQPLYTELFYILATPVSLAAFATASAIAGRTLGSNAFGMM